MKQAYLFISSTFSDFAEERNILHTRVFPRLEEYCLKNGCSFHPVDLRWGISEEDGSDYSTLDICLREVRRCRQLTPRPNFILLAGDRYGWRPLPGWIPLALGDRIAEVLDADEKAVFTRAYAVDTNAVPSEYRLFRPDGEQAAPLLRRAAEKLALSKTERELLTASATHRELLEALSAGDFPQSAVCAIRSLAQVPPEQVPVYFDTDRDGNPDAEAVAAADGMKALIREICRDPVEYELNPAGDEEEKKQALEAFADSVYSRLEAFLEKEFSLEGPPEAEEEAAYHAAYAQKLAREFCGREKILAEAKALAEHKPGQERSVLVIHGPEGCGKTALMAKLASCLPAAAALFAGLTGSSLDEARFAACLEANRDAETLLIDGFGKTARPRKLLKQLAESSPARSLVLSMGTEEYGSLAKDLPEGAAVLELAPPGDEEAAEILRARLAALGRTVTKEQEQAVLDGYARTRDAHFLDALAGMAASLSSLDGNLPLRRYENRSALYEGLLKDLVEKQHFGPEITSRMAGYLLASRSGLSDKELYDLLSRDPHVREEFEKTRLHALPGEKFLLPYALFSRVFHALEPLLAERYSEGETVWRFATEQAEEAAARYCAGLDAAEIHSRSADCWLETRDHFISFGFGLGIFSLNSAASAPFGRFLCEGPYQLMKAGRLEELFRLLSDTGMLGSMRRRHSEDCLEYWAWIEKNSAHTIPEGFAGLLGRVKAAAESGGKLEDGDINPAIYLTDLLIARGGYGEAVALLSRARQNSAKEGDSIERIQPVCSEIQALLDSGKNSEALALAEDFYSRTPEEESLAYCTLLNAYGQALYRCEQYAQAEEIFRKYHALARRLGSRDHGFSSLKWIASCEKAQMRLDGAMEIYRQLEDEYGEDGNLAELVPIYFEAGVTTFLGGGGLKKPKSYFDRCEALCLKLGNRSWLLELYKTELSFFAIAKEYREILTTFPKYLEYFRLNAPGKKIPLDNLEAYARASVYLYRDHDPLAPDKLETLHMLENYAFMEQCGGLTREILAAAAADCAAPEMYIQVWEFVLETMPAPLRDYIMSRPPDPGYYLREMQRAVNEQYGKLDMAAEEALALRRREGQLTEDEEKHMPFHYMRIAFAMYFAYSVFDRIRDEHGEDAETTYNYSALILIHLQNIYQWLKENTYYLEYKARQPYINGLHAVFKSTEETLMNRHDPFADSVREMDKKVQAGLSRERGENPPPPPEKAEPPAAAKEEEKQPEKTPEKEPAPPDPDKTASFRQELRKIELQRKEEAEKNRSLGEKILARVQEHRAKKLRDKLKKGKPGIRN